MCVKTLDNCNNDKHTCPFHSRRSVTPSSVYVANYTEKYCNFVLVLQQIADRFLNASLRSNLETKATDQMSHDLIDVSGLYAILDLLTSDSVRVHR